MEMGSLLPQKGQGLYAIGSHVQTDGSVDVAKGFPHQTNIPGIVFDEEELDGPFHFLAGFHGILRFRATAAREAEARAGRASAKMWPLRRPRFFPFIRLASAAAT